MFEPVRTCVVCRTKAAKKSFYRFVWDGSKPLLDESQRMQNRGAYCCINESCLSRFLTQKKKWQRVFRK